MKLSDAIFIEYTLKNNFGKFEKEYRFCERRWRFDYCIPDKKIAIEIEGGVWSGGRHTRGKGYINDIEKYNRAVIDGWKLIRFSYNHIRTDYFIKTIETISKDGFK